MKMFIHHKLFYWIAKLYSVSRIRDYLLSSCLMEYEAFKAILLVKSKVECQVSCKQFNEGFYTTIKQPYRYTPRMWFIFPYNYYSINIIIITHFCLHFLKLAFPFYVI